MKQLNLLPLSDPKHLRRLVRAINANRAGVYLSGQIAGTTYNPRLCGAAKLEIRCEDGSTVHYIKFPVGLRVSAFRVAAFRITEDTFSDGGSGKAIIASRLP